MSIVDAGFAEGARILDAGHELLETPRVALLVMLDFTSRQS
jgi:hypothetical protein